MPINILVKHGKEARWDKVVQVMREREDHRRNMVNLHGADAMAKRTQQVLKTIDLNNRGDLFIIDRKLDGYLMDNCRQQNNHSDWRRDASYLGWLIKQPEFSGFTHGQKKGLERLLSDAKDAKLTPFYSVEKESEAKRQADLARLPAHYRGGV